MSKENQEIEVVNEACEETEVVEKKRSKWPIIAGLTAAGVGIGGGIAWVIKKLRDSRLDYVEIDEDDGDYFEEDSLEIEISEE